MKADATPEKIAAMKALGYSPVPDSSPIMAGDIFDDHSEVDANQIGYEANETVFQLYRKTHY